MRVVISWSCSKTGMKSIKHMYTSTKQGYWEDNRQTVFESVNECLDVVIVL